jgi:hypothetical protein
MDVDRPGVARFEQPGSPAIRPFFIPEQRGADDD